VLRPGSRTGHQRLLPARLRHINHTDAELILLESLVSRKVPFDLSKY